MHLCFFIVNKNGQLVFNKVMNPLQNFTANEMIRLSSTFHSMHAISNSITPSSQIPTLSGTQLGSPVMEGITEIVVDTFVLKCLQTLTGVKFLLVSDPHSAKE